MNFLLAIFVKKSRSDSLGSCCKINAQQTWNRTACGVSEGAATICSNQFYTLAQQKEKQRRVFRRKKNARPNSKGSLSDFARLSYFACPHDPAKCGR